MIRINSKLRIKKNLEEEEIVKLLINLAKNLKEDNKVWVERPEFIFPILLKFGGIFVREDKNSNGYYHYEIKLEAEGKIYKFISSSKKEINFNF